MSTATPTPLKNIVVVGGSYVGLATLDALKTAFEPAKGKKRTHRVIVVERNSHFGHLFAVRFFICLWLSRFGSIRISVEERSAHRAHLFGFSPSLLAVPPLRRLAWIRAQGLRSLHHPPLPSPSSRRPSLSALHHARTAQTRPSRHSRRPTNRGRAPVRRARSRDWDQAAASWWDAWDGEARGCRVLQEAPEGG